MFEVYFQMSFMTTIKAHWTGYGGRLGSSRRALATMMNTL